MSHLRACGVVSSLVAVVFFALVFIGCAPAVFNAPPTARISLTASPTQIAEVAGSSTISAIVRLDSGEPAPNGVIVNFFTSLGEIDASAKTEEGIATVTLRSTGVAGVATVSALSGAAEVVTIDVTFGVSVSSVTVSFDPTFLTVSGTSTVTAQVRDDAGEPLAERQVSFSATSPGVLSSGGSSLTTDANGKVTDVVTTSATTTVTATVQGQGGTLTGEATLSVVTTTVRSIALVASPSGLPSCGGDSAITALVTDTNGSPSAGTLVEWSVIDGVVSPLTSTTDSSGIARTTLTADQSASVTAVAETVSDTVAVLVGSASRLPFRVVLSASRTSVTDPTPPGAAACDPSGPHPELPITIEAKVLDSGGGGVGGVAVTLTVEDDTTITTDGQGGFCPSTSTATTTCACPSSSCSSTVLVKTTTATTASDGVATFSFAFEDPDFCDCSGINCETIISACAASSVSLNNVRIAFQP